MPDQPWGDKETRTGAITRAKGALVAAPRCDFSVGLEGGVGGDDVSTVDGGVVECFAYMAVLRASDIRLGIAKTASFAVRLSRDA